MLAGSQLRTSSLQGLCFTNWFSDIAGGKLGFQAIPSAPMFDQRRAQQSVLSQLNQV